MRAAILSLLLVGCSFTLPEWVRELGKPAPPTFAATVSFRYCTSVYTDSVVIESAAAWAKRWNRPLTVWGNADCGEGRERNQLAQSRAYTIKRRLHGLGVDSVVVLWAEPWTRSNTQILGRQP